MENKRHAALGFVFITVLLDMLAFGIIVPIMPKLITEFLNGNMAKSSEYMGLFVTTWALMQFFFSPILGILSDRFGRRPVILLSNFGLGLDYVVMALAPSIGWLFLGRIASGICSSSMPTATAYISDVTPPEKRAKAFGLFGAAFGVGFVLGPAIGGWLGAMSARLPFWVAAGLSLLNAMYGLFVLPESLAKENRQSKFNWRKANPVGALKLLSSHPELLGLAVVNFLAYLAHEIYSTVWVLYAMYRYNWDEKAVGTSLAVVGVASMITMAGLVGPAVKKLGERKAMLVGLFFGALGFALFGWAPLGWIFLAVIPVNMLWGLATPPSQSMMTKRVSASEQGELQGALSSLRGLAMIFGPPLFAGTFAASIAHGRNYPAAPWYLAAVILFISVAIAAKVTVGAAVGETSPVEEPTVAG
jgi:MFS transporter, DHA1 family, tetracycline resistance protein